MYHVASSAARASILAHGLDPALGERQWAGEYPQATYLWAELEDAAAHGEAEHAAPLGDKDVWQVDTAGLAVEADPLATSLTGARFMVRRPIEPDRLTLVPDTEWYGRDDWDEATSAA
jgi:hypothetical protein